MHMRLFTLESDDYHCDGKAGSIKMVKAVYFASKATNEKRPFPFNHLERSAFIIYWIN